MEKSRRILFTGISGIGIRSALKKLADFVGGDPRKREVCVVEAEEHLTDAVESLGLFPGPGTATHAEATIRSLALPKALLRDCWRKALTKSLDERAIDNTPKDVFLHAHVCFYHQKTREFFTLLDFELIEKRLRPDAVVTLVDDIEDIHARLREPGQMFEKLIHDYHGLAGIARACQNVSTLMHWRAAEFSAAEQLALRLKRPHYLLAVKHSLQIAANLVLQDAPRPIYISHPISEPRRRLAAGETEQFEEFTARLSKVCAPLREQGVLFEPTTIDEFRFRRFTASGNDAKPIYLPTLTPRWPLSNDAKDLLWDPVGDDDLNPIDPHEYFSEEQLSNFESANSNQEGAHAGDDLQELDVASALTGALVGTIEDQVAARDLKLVEQSPGLFVVRPLFAGNASRGVKEEIKFHCQLVNAGELSNAKIWIFTTEADERAYRINRATSWLFSKLDGADVELLEELRSDVSKLDFDSSFAELVAALHQVAVEREKNPLITTGGTLTGTKEGEAINEKQIRARELESALKFPYQEIIDSYGGKINHEVYYGESWPRDELLHKIKKEISDGA